MLGTAQMPAARPATFENLASGREDSQFVEIQGIVRGVHLDAASQYHLVEMATGGGRLSIYARQLPVSAMSALLDATVRVRGVCSTQFTHQRQLFAIRLMVPGPDDMELLIPAPADPFGGKARTLGELQQFAMQEANGHRVKVMGTVTYFEPGRMLFLQSGGQGVEVRTESRAPLHLGDEVEALGFASHGIYTPLLTDAIYRKTASGPALSPTRVTCDEALTGTHDGCLIQVTARLLERAQDGAAQDLILQSDGVIFHASLRPGSQLGFVNFENGSTVTLTGVCRIDPGDWQAGVNWRAQSFHLQLRMAEDVVLLARPPWWTLQRVLWIAGGLGTLLAAAFAWVMVLRRQVAERTRQLEIQIQERQHAERRQLMEQERTRLAQDLHDDLGATLTEVTTLSSLARNAALPGERREACLAQLTDVSRSLVTTLDEIVWAVNPQYDSVSSLASYYSLFAQRFLNLSGMACRLQVAPAFPHAPLDSRTRHGVFLAFKEALHNAVRHSGATETLIRMKADDGELRIEVTDNGCGFQPSATVPSQDGLQTMRHRMQQLGGHCQITSAPERGTTVAFTYPLAETRL